MASTAKPLTHCPVCRYDLTGLPKTYTCPECGFEYDESMRTWSIRPGKWMVILYLGCLFLAASSVARGIWYTRSFSLLCGVIMAVMLIRDIRWFHSRPCLVMAGGGLYVQKLRTKKIVFYPWSDIRLSPDSKDDTRTPRTLWGLVKTDLTPYTAIYQVSAGGKSNKRIFLPIGHASRKHRKAVYQEIYERWQSATKQASQANDAEVT